MRLTDNCVMPFGTHAGKKMCDIPASYLLWLCDEIRNGRDTLGGPRGALVRYVDASRALLEAEAAESANS